MIDFPPLADLGVFDIAGTAFDVVEFAPGVDLGIVEQRTGARS